MFYPPLFTSVPRPFDPSGPSVIGGSVVDVPLVGATATRESNPLDLTAKALVHSQHSTQNALSTPVTDPSNTDPSELMMLDHRKLANLAASHTLSTMGRQMGPTGAATALIDPTLYRLAYGPEGLVPPPFCYDRATGVAVPTSLAGHQLMASFLQQQQRDRCLEQQQALFAARTTAAQQAAVAAAAAFMDPASLPFNLRTAMSQRETAAALAATRAMYPPTMPAPMVLPAFSLYTDDKGAFTSLRNGGAPDKAFINGTTTLEAARFAEHLQRIREQHLQQAAKCSNSCCSSLSSLGPTVPCACCIQSPSQAALCARSPMGCGVKDPTTAATANKVSSATCDFLQPGLTYLQRSSVPTSNSNNAGDVRIPTVPTVSHCVSSTTTSSIGNKDIVSTANSAHVFQPITTWTSGLPQVSNSGKTAFSVPKKKDNFKEISNTTSKENKVPKEFDNVKSYYSQSRDIDRNIFTIKKEYEKKDEIAEPIFIHRDVPNTASQYRREHDVKSLLAPKTTIVTSAVMSKNNAASTHHQGVAHTTLTTVTSTVPTKCEGGTILAKTSKMPPVLEPFRSIEPQIVNSERYSRNNVTNPISSSQGPPALIATPNNQQSTVVNGKQLHKFSIDALRHQPAFHPGLSSPYKTNEKPLPAPDIHCKSPKKFPITTKSSGLPSYVKEEEPATPVKTQSSSISALPKPIPHLPPPPTSHLPPAHYANPYRPYSHLQNASNWLLPSHPNVTVAPPQPSKSSSSSSSSTSLTSATPIATVSKIVDPIIKRESDPSNSGSNVLQSLLVKPGTSLAIAPSVPGAFPILDYQYHQQTHFRHGLNLSQGGVGAATIESASPATASIAPPLDKVEIKVEGSGGSDFFASTGTKCSKKRQSSVPIKTEYKCPEKKRNITIDPMPAPVPGYTFQYTPLPTELKDSLPCPYTFVPEPPGYYEHQVLVPSEIRSQKTGLSVIHPLETKPLIESQVKIHNSDFNKNYVIEESKFYRQPFYNTIEFHIKNAKRCAMARARSKLYRRALSRIYQKYKNLYCLEDHSIQNPPIVDDQPCMFDTYQESPIRPLIIEPPVVPTVVPSSTPPTMTEGRLIFKIAKRRRIRSGLDMALKKTKKKPKRDIYKVEETYSIIKQTHESSPQKIQYGPGMIPVPADMKRLMVNKALGETILHRAARLGYPEVVAYCLETNCGNVNIPDNAGYTPLHECCSRGHLEIARALLQYGADVNASAAGGIRPLHDAVENDHVEIVRLLLSFGADPTIATYSGLTPLKLAHSPLMAEFLQGFMVDISGEMDKRPYLPWRFWGSASCLDPTDNGYDVFDGVPNDNEAEVEGEGDDFLFEVSDSPHLPTFRLPMSSSSNTKLPYNFLRLSDVLRKMCINRDLFLQHYGHIEVLTVPRHEFEASATCSQLLSGSKMEIFSPIANHRLEANFMEDNSHTVDLVKLDSPIRKLLGIETICVR